MTGRAGETARTELAVARLVACYEGLTPASLADLGACYAADAQFRDPFNQVEGRSAILRIFEHMFATADAPRFRVTWQMVQGREAMLGWEFHLRLRGQPRVIEGVSHLRFDGVGQVVAHRDYWDAVGELYEKLPVVGAGLAWLRRRLAAPQP
ncbi:nuclear transport factor 2 family protein [Zoogloea sp.]|uniref:nuclear transport factor 2 family protein n=1 Tax=Zoogloea sp. TaxID=49181 RepID=UPI0035B05AD6